MNWKERRRLAIIAAKEAERVRSLAQLSRSAAADAIEVAIQCGCEVVFKSLPSLEGMYSPQVPAIILGSERPAGRRAFTCAHELGHHVFNHGTNIEEISNDTNNSADELLADMFAAFLLMSQTAVLRTLKDRGWTASTLQPEQAYRLANFFGVGYGTIISHMEWSLKIMPTEHAEQLRKTQPKQIKSSFNTATSSEVIFVDYFWRHRAVDLEIGDTLVLPPNTCIDPGNQLKLIIQDNDFMICRAEKTGISRAFNIEKEWAVNMRICRKNYEGFAQYRFLEESEDDNES